MIPAMTKVDNIKLDVFREKYIMPQEYKYVWATINTKEEMLSVSEFKIN